MMRMGRTIIIMLVLGWMGSVLGSELVEVLPLTDRIMMLHFDDGHVIHHTRGHQRTDEQVVIEALDVETATRAQTYSISSPDDSAWVGALHPVKVGRKSKGTDFAWFVDSWQDGRAVNQRPDHAKEHWLYLFLTQPMQPGKTYQFSTQGLSGEDTQHSLIFDVNVLRSEAVHVNLLGYVPDAPQKYGYVYHWLGDQGGLDLKAYADRTFHLIDTDTGRSVYQGQLRFRKSAESRETYHPSDSPPNGNYLKADVYECDFSEFKTPGTYRLSVEGIGCSFAFQIQSDIYRKAFRTVTRGLYHNRSGIALTEPYTEFTRPAPHNPLVTPRFAGKLLYTTVRFTEWGSEGGDAKALLEASKGPVNAWGWYQDAGDWDSYVTHLRVAQELLFAYELRPANFTDGELNIPESGNGLPDILDEAAWLPRFCCRLRHELMDRSYGTGGLGLRIAGDAFGEDTKTLPNGKHVGQGSWEDVNRTWVVSGEDPWSTYRYAGTAAHLALLLQRLNVPDPNGVDWATEARECYDWAQQYTRSGDEQKANLKAHRSYAAAALFRLTGKDTYQQQCLADTQDIQSGSMVEGDQRYGVWMMLQDRAKINNEAITRLRQAVLHTADVVAVDAPKMRALRWGGNPWMPMLIGQQTTPWILDGAIAEALVRQEDPNRARTYRAALYTTCDYFLGTNALNMTWVTGLGPRHPVHVFHMDAWYNGKGRFHPGIIPYGPWRKERDLGQGPWDHDWPNVTTYPPIDEWPGNERWFDNRCSPMNSEFTIHQNLSPAAAIFGILCETANQSAP